MQLEVTVRAIQIGMPFRHLGLCFRSCDIRRQSRDGIQVISLVNLVQDFIVNCVGSLFAIDKLRLTSLFHNDVRGLLKTSALQD